MNYAKLTEKMFEKRKRVIAVTVLFLIAAALILPTIKMDNRMEKFLAPGDPVASLFVRTGELFGTNKVIFVIVESTEGDIFKPEVLKFVKEASDVIMRKNGVKHIINIFNITDIKPVEGGIEVGKLMKDIPPAEKLKEIKKYALSREMFTKSVI